LLLLAVSKRDSHIVRGIAGANSHQNVVLVIGVRGLDCVTDVAGVRHALPSNLKNNIASLKPLSAAALFGSTSVTTTPFLPAPATELAGVTVRPSRGTSETMSGSAFASCTQATDPR